MRTVTGFNVNDAWAVALDLMAREGVRSESRNGPLLVHPEPVSTTYLSPRQRVLFDPVRNSNPIFSVMESLWMLAGRDDATWLDQFVRDFSARFSEDGGRMHGAYGKRWRGWFERDKPDAGSGIGIYPPFKPIDQLDEVVSLLKKDKYDRQAVIQMWDAERDLGVPGLKDRPCNTQIYLRCDRTETPYMDPPVTDENSAEWELKIAEDRLSHVLDMTVTCRSNDIVFGCYGANAVHFSFLQEYLAARIGVKVGTYTQVSNNWHMYDWSKNKVDLLSAQDSRARHHGPRYPATLPLVDDPETFDLDCRHFVEEPSNPWTVRMSNRFFYHTAQPMFYANQYRLSGDMAKAQAAASRIGCDDWRLATTAWLSRLKTAGSVA